MILLKECLQKLLFTGAGLSELSSCLFLASSSDDHDAVTLILEQITKWNNNNTNTNKKKQKHTKNKKHHKKHHKRKKNIIGIDDLINSTNNNSDGNMLTPLHIACLLHNGRMASSLIQYGANKYARDANGETPFDDLGLTELITQYENALLRTEANKRANQRDHSQQHILQKEQTVRDMEWSEKLADVEAQDQMQYGTEQTFGKGWDDTTTNDVLNEAGGHSDGDWWSRIATERKQKKQKQKRQQRSAEEKAAAASAFAAFATSGNKKRSHSNIAGDNDGNCGGTSTNNNESSSDNNKKKDTAGTTTGSTEIIIIDPIEARAIDNRAWSAFIEKLSPAVAAAAAAVVVSTNKTTTLKTTATTTEGAATSSPSSSSSSLLLVTETKDDDPIIHIQSNRMTMTDVPWPCMGDDTPFPGGSRSSSAVSVLTPGERKVYHRQLIRRWHPDKFLQRFHSHLRTEKEEEDDDDDDDNRSATRILKRVTAVFQSINNNNM